jgi:hypothetical protein
MAVALNNKVHSSGTMPGSSYLDVTYDAGTGTRLLVVITRVGSAVDNPSSITFNGVSMTKSISWIVDGAINFHVWTLESPASGSNTLRLSNGNASDRPVDYLIFYATGCKATGAFGAYDEKTVSGTDGSQIDCDSYDPEPNSLIVAWAVFHKYYTFSAWHNSLDSEISQYTLGSTFEKAALGSLTVDGSARTDGYTLTTSRTNFRSIVAFEIKVAASNGPANVKTYKGLAAASVKTCKGLAIASVKSKKGLA